MCRKLVIFVSLLILTVFSSQCFALSRVPFCNNFDLQGFVQKYNNRQIGKGEFSIISVKKMGRVDNGQVRYACVLSDNYSYLALDMSGNDLYGLSVIALPKNQQIVINSLYSAAEMLGSPGGRDAFWDALSAAYNKKTCRFARQSKGFGYEDWVVEGRDVNIGIMVGIAIWKV